MINIAFIMLFGDRAKYLMLISGIGVSTVLMVQGMALFCGLLSFSFANLTNIRSPIWVADPIIEQVGDSQPLRDTDISRVRSVSGVGWAAPLFIGNTQARLPEVGVTKQVILIGLDATTFMGAPTELIAGSLEDLRQPDSVIVDERSLTQLAADRTKPLALGDTFEMNDRTARVVGICKASAALGPGSFVFTTYDRAVQYAPSQRKTLSYVLVHPQVGRDAAEVAAAITRETGLHARTETEFRNSTVRWTLFNSPIPFVVGIIVGIGFLVGVVISGQVFYSFVLENSRYLGAFRAMGAETGTLTRIILVQAATVGLVGYSLGLGLISLVISTIPGGKVPLLLLWPVPLVSLAAIMLICAVAAALGIHRIAKLEPAIVFRG
jgi:putative ABC transport system permease protein